MSDRASRFSAGLAPVVTLAACLVLAGVPPAAQAEQLAQVPLSEDGPFVRVQGTRFLLGAQPFYFVGTNLNVMHHPDARRQAEETLAAAAADGLQVGRIWALGEGLGQEAGWKRKDFLFRDGPEGWQEEAFSQLDRVIAAAGARGLKLVITLSNSWADYGGVPMYLRWAGHLDVESYGYSDRFFTDQRCQAWYAEHVRRVVGRTNSITGIPYRDDPTIMAWELQNEMHGTPEGAEDRRRWVVAMARLVRSLDSNHLVVPGVIGYKLQLERDNWIAMNSLPEVSYCDQHIYPREHLLSRSKENLRRFIDDRVQLAHHVVGKPIVFGEFGFADRGPPGPRVAWHKLFLERLFYDGGNGALVWIYQPTLHWRRTYGILVDQPRYHSLRRMLGDQARQVGQGKVRAQNPALGPAQGSRPLAPTHALLTRSLRPHGRWRRDLQDKGRSLLTIPVDRFARAWFEEAGSWDGGILVHAYGRRTGWFEYRFRGPPFRPAQLVIRARLSSEYPGRYGPPHGFSRVALLLDGQSIGELRVMPDNGQGQWYTLEINDPSLLGRLRGGEHRLRFAVPAGEEANGVALYGREAQLNREPVEEPGPLQLIALPRGGAGVP